VLMRMAAGIQLQQPENFDRYLDAVFDAMWIHPQNLNEPAQIDQMLQTAGFDAQALRALADEARTKEALKHNTERAVERGVFGAPSFFVGEDLYWGHDRLPQVEQALAAQS